MEHSFVEKFLTEVREIEDPRDLVRIKYTLDEILLLVLLATLSSCDTMVDIANYGVERIDFLREYLPYKNGTPSHDTLSLILGMIKPEACEKMFLAWVSSMAEDFSKDVISIDGKTIKGSRGGSNGKSGVHIVSAFASNSNMILGQMKVKDKTNEITAIPELLQVLQIDGGIVTVDAMGCQEKIARQIIDQKADYILGLKKNQKELHKEVQDFFEAHEESKFLGIEYDFYETLEKDHGRIESRKVWVSEDISLLRNRKGRWSGLKSIAMVKSTRDIKGKISNETRYYISSLEGNAELIGSSIRKHWGIENKVHWILDVVMNEDFCRSRNANSAQNLACIRKIALNMLKQQKGKDSIRALRFKSALNPKITKLILSNIKNIP